MSDEPRSEADLRWLGQFVAAFRRDYNNLPHRMPPAIRQAMDEALIRDSLIRQLDAQAQQLEATRP